MSFLTDLWDSIWDALKSVWDAISEYLAIALVLVAIFFCPWLGVSGFFGVTVAASTGWIIFVGALVASYLIDPTAIGTVLSYIGEVIGEVVEAVTDVVSSAVSSAIGAFFSSPIGMLTAGAGLWWFFGRDKEEKSNQQIEEV